jgi:hypothetical protein
MKRIFPQNYPLMLLLTGEMYGFIGYFGMIKTKQYILLLILIMLFVFIMNRRVYIAYNHLIIVQGFSIIKVKYNDINKLLIKNVKPKLAQFSVPAILISTINGEKKIFYHRMYSTSSLTKIITTMTNVNNRIILSANIKSFING